MAGSYVTRGREAWDQIALEVYGDERMMGELLRANPQYTDTLLFEAGVELVTPESAPLNAVNLPPWKQEA